MASLFRVVLSLMLIPALVAFMPLLKAAEISLSDDEAAWLAQRDDITVGTFEPGWLPFEGLDEAGSIQGVGPAYLRIVAGALKLRIVPKPFSSWPEALKAACNGQVDVLMNVALVPQRTNCLVFSRPYIDVPSVIIGPTSLAGLDDQRVATSRIAVESGFATSAALAERMPLAHQVVVPSIEQALEAINQGKADLYIGNPYVAARLLRMPEFNDLAILRAAGLPFSSLHFAVNEQNKHFASAISKALASISDAQRQAIAHEWLEPEPAHEYNAGRVALSLREREWLAELPKLRLGFDAGWDAISPSSNGNLGGVAGEYARILEERLGIRFTPVPATDQAELAELMTNGKVDVAISTRGRALNTRWTYTDPILSLANVIVSRADRVPVSGGYDLNGLNVATVGQRRKELILELAQSANIAFVDSAMDGFRRVERGTSDVYIGDVVTVNRTLRESRSPLRISAPADFEEAVVISVMPDKDKLALLMNRVLAALRPEEHQRIRSGWLQVAVQSGVSWRTVMAAMAIAAILIGILAISYAHVRREIARREKADALVSDLTRNLPGAVFTIITNELRELEASYVGGNTNKLFGLAPERIMQRFESFLDILNPQDRRRMAALLTSQDATPLELDFAVEKRWIRMSAAPRRSSTGDVKWSGYWADATEERAQLDALASAKVSAEVAANAKATFLATMSHEIRTPMSGLSGLLEVIGRSKLTAGQDRLLKLATAAARSLRELLDDVLDYSRIEAGRLRVEMTDLHVRDLLCDAVLLMSGAAEQKGIQINCVIDPDLAGILEGDASRIRQIVINLLSNAIKFTDHGNVTLRASLVSGTDSRQSWAIEITDTGVGMSRDELKLLFQPFSQAQAGVKRPGGSGLGLAISQRLAGLMEGRISLSSQPGIGTTARLELSSTVTRMAATHPDLAGQRVLLHCANRDVSGAILSDLRALGMIAIDNLDEAELVITDDPDSAHGIKQPIIRLVEHTPLGALSVHHDALGCHPVLFTAVRDASLRALGYSAFPDASHDETPFDQGAPSVLVAEDDPANQALIKEQLAELGCRSVVVGDGIQALRAWEQQTFDLLITDMQMPGLDGIGLVTEIRRRELARSIARTPVVALSASSFTEDVNRCIAAGMDDHIAKPADLSELRDALYMWTGRRLIPEAISAERSSPASYMAPAIRAFEEGASQMRDELDAAIASMDEEDIRRTLHRSGGALAVVGQKDLAKRIRSAIVKFEADGIQTHFNELAKIHREIEAFIEKAASGPEAPLG